MASCVDRYLKTIVPSIHLATRHVIAYTRLVIGLVTSSRPLYHHNSVGTVYHLANTQLNCAPLHYFHTQANSAAQSRFMHKQYI
jgi:hypothetical protein